MMGYHQVLLCEFGAGEEEQQGEVCRFLVHHHSGSFCPHKWQRHPGQFALCTSGIMRISSLSNRKEIFVQVKYCIAANTSLVGTSTTAFNVASALMAFQFGLVLLLQRGLTVLVQTFLMCRFGSLAGSLQSHMSMISLPHCSPFA